MQNVRTVTIGAIVATANPNDVLVAYGLGSCVAICMYDPEAYVGGMLHALLPSVPNNINDPENPAKFVDRGVPLLIKNLEKLGANQSRLVTYLCGGAKMLVIPGEDNQPHIGERNVKAAEDILREVDLKICGRSTGGSNGRTLKFFINNGDATVNSLGQTETILRANGRLKPNMPKVGSMAGGNYVHSNGR